MAESVNRLPYTVTQTTDNNTWLESIIRCIQAQNIRENRKKQIENDALYYLTTYDHWQRSPQNHDLFRKVEEARRTLENHVYDLEASGFRKACDMLKAFLVFLGGATVLTILLGLVSLFMTITVPDELPGVYLGVLGTLLVLSLGAALNIGYLVAKNCLYESKATFFKSNQGDLAISIKEFAPSELTSPSNTELLPDQP